MDELTLLERLVNTLLNIRVGAAFTVRLPDSSHALSYEQIAEMVISGMEH